MAAVVEPGHSPRTRAETSLLMASIAALWLAGFIVWWGSLWHADAYLRAIGTDALEFVPEVTKLAVSSAKIGFPLILSALCSGVVVYLLRAAPHRSTVLVAWLLCAYLAYVAIALFALTAPMTRLCGELVPGWPSCGPV